MLSPKLSIPHITRNGRKRKRIIQVLSTTITVGVIFLIVLGDRFMSNPPVAHQIVNLPVAKEKSDGIAQQSNLKEQLISEATLSDRRWPVDTCQTHEGSGDDFGHHLEILLELLPEETQRRALLQPIQGTGKTALRELGLRTREFKRLFDAWEAVHVVQTKDLIYIRDDVLQFLRCEDHTDQSNSKFRLAAAIQSYEAFRSLLTSMAQALFPWTSPYFADHISLHAHIKNGGRGIVVTAGDKQAAYLLTGIQIIRKLGCTLPVEIMYLGDDDLGPDFRAELENIDGVITRDLKRMVDDRGWELSTWAGKPFALLLSSFREVILLDADALFFKNPALLFNDAGYLETGALFFYDRILSVEDRRLRFQQPVFFHDQESVARLGRRWLEQIFPEPISSKAKQSRLWTGQSRQVQESGVIVVDKWRHFVSLLLVTWINGPGRKGEKDKGEVGFYDMFYGDKESYWIGWELAGDVEYSFQEGQLAILGNSSQYQSNDLDAKTVGDSNGKEEEPAITNLALPSGISSSKPNGRIKTSFDRDIKICAPQLLHLDEDGSPLWFNGWILMDKFNKSSQTLVEFENYMPEPTVLRDPEAWYIGDHNLACLTARETFGFTAAEEMHLKDIVRTALDIGSYKPGQAPLPQVDFY